MGSEEWLTIALVVTAIACLALRAAASLGALPWQHKDEEKSG